MSLMGHFAGYFDLLLSCRAVIFDIIGRNFRCSCRNGGSPGYFPISIFLDCSTYFFYHSPSMQSRLTSHFGTLFTKSCCGSCGHKMLHWMTVPGRHSPFTLLCGVRHIDRHIRPSHGSTIQHWLCHRIYRCCHGFLPCVHNPSNFKHISFDKQ